MIREPVAQSKDSKHKNDQLCSKRKCCINIIAGENLLGFA